MQINHLDIEHCFDLPCHVYWKDTKGTYQGSNDYPVKVMGINKGLDFVGFNDRDLLKQDAAALIHINDNAVISKRLPLTVPEKAQWANEILQDYHVISYKQPLYNKTGKKVIGIMGYSFHLPNNKTTHSLVNKTKMLVQHAITHHFKPCSTNEMSPVKSHLPTQRQLDCLYYLVLGYTAKDIASILGLSRRTIEHYLDNLKLKFNCVTRPDLIALALELPAIRNRLLNAST